MPATSKNPRIALISVMHESNSFNPEPTTLDRFTFKEESTLEETLDLWAKGNTEVAGMIEEGRRSSFQLVPILHASATPAGPVQMDAFEEIWQRVSSGLMAKAPFDGVLLALHGAMYSPIFPHADEEIVRRVRAAIGSRVPLIVTHDFHANIPPSLLPLTNALLTYQQNPHTDTHRIGSRAAFILAGILNGSFVPKQAIVKPQLLWNIVFQATSKEPLKSITEASIVAEKKPGVLAASVAGGYQYGDVPHMGPSVIVVTDGKNADAKQEAESLAQMMWSRREDIRLNLPTPVQAVADAMKSTEFPVALFDIGDNIGGGSPGDETALLAELVSQQARGWVFVAYDPKGVEAAKAAGVGGAFNRNVGGHSSGVHGRPVKISGTVRNLSLGKFVEPEVRHGGHRYWDMGHAAVIEVSGSTADEQNLLLLTSKPSPPFSIHQLTSCGIYPERQKILIVKGVVAPRAAYQAVAKLIVLVDTPGLTAVNPAHFKFERANRKLWGMPEQA